MVYGLLTPLIPADSRLFNKKMNVRKKNLGLAWTGGLSGWWREGEVVTLDVKETVLGQGQSVTIRKALPFAYRPGARQ